MVAHRLSTLVDADRILVFEAGRLVEEGPYQDLVRRGGVFAHLVASAEKTSSQEAYPAAGVPSAT
jgi:ABC-type multidrug transport system fused ATPase/permease subunit